MYKRYAAPLIMVILICLGVSSLAFATDASGNIRLSVPSQIPYGVKGDGSLISPSSSSLKIDNSSSFEVRISSVKMNPGDDWNVVDNAYASSLPNSVSITLGPVNDQMKMSACTGAAKDVGNEIAWTMSSHDVDEAASSIQLVSSGYAANVRDAGVVGNIEWYVVSDTVTNQILSDIADLEDRMDSAIVGIERDGTTFTAAHSDGSTSTFDQKDDDTTYSAGGGLALESGVFSNAGVTGIKGSAESAFRAGDVSLSPGNIGAKAWEDNWQCEPTLRDTDFYTWVENSSNIHTHAGFSNQVISVRFYSESFSTYHLPTADQHVSVYSLDGGTTWIKCVAYSVRTNTIYVNTRMNNTWSGWQQVVMDSYSTATATLNSTYVKAGRITFSKRNGTVSVTADNITFVGHTGRQTIATVPVGYRPADVIYAPITTDLKYYLMIYPDGSIKTDAKSADVRIWGSACYVVSG